MSIPKPIKQRLPSIHTHIHTYILLTHITIASPLYLLARARSIRPCSSSTSQTVARAKAHTAVQQPRVYTGSHRPAAISSLSSAQSPRLSLSLSLPTAREIYAHSRAAGARSFDRPASRDGGALLSCACECAKSRVVFSRRTRYRIPGVLARRREVRRREGRGGSARRVSFPRKVSEATAVCGDIEKEGERAS